jgi:hypothetical protein
MLPLLTIFWAIRKLFFLTLLNPPLNQVQVYDFRLSILLIFIRCRNELGMTS